MLWKTRTSFKIPGRHGGLDSIWFHYWGIALWVTEFDSALLSHCNCSVTDLKMKQNLREHLMVFNVFIFDEYNKVCGNRIVHSFCSKLHLLPQLQRKKNTFLLCLEKFCMFFVGISLPRNWSLSEVKKAEMTSATYRATLPTPCYPKSVKWQAHIYPEAVLELSTVKIQICERKVRWVVVSWVSIMSDLTAQ